MENGYGERESRFFWVQNEDDAGFALNFKLILELFSQLNFQTEFSKKCDHLAIEIVQWKTNKKQIKQAKQKTR